MSFDVNMDRPVSTRPLFRRDEQQVVMLIGFLCSLLVGWYGVGYCGLPRHCVHVDRSHCAPVSFRLRLNSATWSELTQMPGIAETLARRIVSHREEHGPFASIEELDQVHGIGPKLLQGMQPYLVPMERRGRGSE